MFFGVVFCIFIKARHCERSVAIPDLQSGLHDLLFYGIAALSVTFLLTDKRKVTKRKLSTTF